MLLSHHDPLINGRAWTLIALYALQTLLQSIAMLALQRWKHVGIWREMFYVLTQVKIIVDFFRSISPKTSRVKQMENEGLGNFREEMMNNFSACAVVSMPIIMSHGNTLLRTSQNPFFVILAITMNIFTTTLALAIVTLDKDCDVKTRRTMGEFYGMFSEQPLMKSVAFFSMLTFSITQLLAMTISTVLLDVVIANNAIYFVMGGQLSLFFLYKLSRGDFLYWVQFESAPQNFTLAVIVRLVIYLISSSTGYPKFRHPLDMGGRVWTASVLLTHINCIGVIYYCIKYKQERLANNPNLEPESLLHIYSAVAIVWLLSIFTFSYSIKAKYRRTFWDNAKGSDFLRANFRNAPNDEVRAEIFGYNFNYWSEDSFNKEVREWLETNWEKWR